MPTGSNDDWKTEKYADWGNADWEKQRLGEMPSERNAEWEKFRLQEMLSGKCRFFC
jgi:hypothetical protein